VEFLCVLCDSPDGGNYPQIGPVSSIHLPEMASGVILPVFLDIEHHAALTSNSHVTAPNCGVQEIYAQMTLFQMDWEVVN
jgi:hypothetical protein